MRALSLILTISLSLMPAAALAYVGPGLGLGAVGVIIALLISIILAVIGLLWYPLKRRLARKKRAAGEPDAKADAGDNSA